MGDYVTLVAFKEAIRFDGAERDNEFKQAITAASRQVDRLVRYGVDDVFMAVVATRHFPHQGGAARLFMPPLLSVTTLKTDTTGDGVFDTVWAATDYAFGPWPGPFRHVEPNVLVGRYNFPKGYRSIEIAGTWGLAATPPAEVIRATIILANRYVNRPKTPEGIAGSVDKGFVDIKRTDPDVAIITEHWLDPMALFGG